MVQQLALFAMICLSLSAFGQDERYYRQILSGELPEQLPEFRELVVHQFNVQGPAYQVDLNGNGTEESIIPQKRDGVDWLEIRNFSGNRLFEAKLLAQGAESTIYKIRLVQLSPKVRVLIVFLDEGHTKGKKLESTGRVFFISYEDNDLSTMSLAPGPRFFHEKEAQREQYWRRKYAVNVYDINNDGTREIAIQYNHIQRIYQYLGRGQWKRL